METKKMIWGNPELDVQKFVPQYCAGPCTNKEGDKVIWEATCNSSQSLIFYGAGPDDWTWDTSRGGCGHSHTFEMTAGDPITANCWIMHGVNISNWENNTNRNYWVTTGSGWNQQRTHQLKPELVAGLIENGTLVPAYYNSNCISGGFWLVTDDLQHFHIVS